MAEQAKISSLEALEAFRSNLIVFLTKGNNSLNQVTDEVRRTKMWLENDQRLHWEMELRKRKRVLDQAEGELLTAKRSSFRNDLAAQMLAVRRAKDAVEEAERKLRNVKRWAQNFESTLEPVAKKLGRMKNFLGYDLPKGVAYLAQVQKTLADYTGVGTVTLDNSSMPSGAEGEASAENFSEPSSDPLDHPRS